MSIRFQIHCDKLQMFVDQKIYKQKTTANAKLHCYIANDFIFFDYSTQTVDRNAHTFKYHIQAFNMTNKTVRHVRIFKMYFCCRL